MFLSTFHRKPTRTRSEKAVKKLQKNIFCRSPFDFRNLTNSWVPLLAQKGKTNEYLAGQNSCFSQSLFFRVKNIKCYNLGILIIETNKLIQLNCLICILSPENLTLMEVKFIQAGLILKKGKLLSP